MATISPFSALLHDVSEQVNQDNLQKLMVLADLTPCEKDKVKNCRELLDKLIEQDKVSPGNLTFLKDILKKVGLHKAVILIEDYEHRVHEDSTAADNHEESPQEPVAAVEKRQSRNSDGNVACGSTEAKTGNTSATRVRSSPLTEQDGATLEKFGKRLLANVDLCRALDYAVEATQEKDKLTLLREMGVCSEDDLLISFCKQNRRVYESLIAFLEQTESTRPVATKIKQIMKNAANPLTMELKHETIGEYKMTDDNFPNKITVVILGQTGSGKSETGNLISGKQTFKVVRGQNSATKSVEFCSASEDSVEFLSIDTPGLFDTDGSFTSDDILTAVVDILKLCPDGVHIFLMVRRADVKFTKQEKETFDEIQRLMGADIFKRSLLVLTHFDDVLLDGKDITTYLEASAEFGPLYEKIGRRAVGLAIEQGDRNKPMYNIQRQNMLRAICDLAASMPDEYTDESFRKAKWHMENKQKRYQSLKQVGDLILKWMIFELPDMKFKEIEGILSPNEMNTSGLKKLQKLIHERKIWDIKNADINFLTKTFISENEKILELLLENRPELKATNREMFINQALSNHHRRNQVVDHILKHDMMLIRDYFRKMTFPQREAVLADGQIRFTEEIPGVKQSLSNFPEFDMVNNVIRQLLREELREELCLLCHLKSMCSDGKIGRFVKALLEFELPMPRVAKEAIVGLSASVLFHVRKGEAEKKLQASKVKQLLSQPTENVSKTC